MAISTATFTKVAGWARTDVIDQLEQAFTWLGWHGSQISGLVTSISAYSGGGTVGVADTDYYDVPVATTTGIGTGATFNVYRGNGPVNYVSVNRPGVGYTQGEYVTLSADNIGGSGNGAVSIGITVNVDGGLSPVGYGGTGVFFDKNFTPTNDSTRPWGVLKQDFDTNKRFGVTYRGFKVHSNYQMSLYAGSSFFPYNVDNTSNRGGNYRDSFRGMRLLDIPYNADSADNSLDYTSDNNAQISAVYDDLFRFATSNSPTTHNLNLNIYRSGIDPSFAVLSYNQPSISGTINDSTFSTFIIHNFTSNLYNFNEVFSAGVTFVVPYVSINSSGGNTAQIGFRTLISGNKLYNESYLTGRVAEMGWSQVYSEGTNYGIAAQNYNISSSQTNYTSASSGGMANFDSIINMPSTIFSRTGGLKDKGLLTTSNSSYGNIYPITTYNSVIKGIPINGNLIPCPYYMPDDFVLIDFKLTASGQDLKQGDTVTISGSEVYTVITGSYNKYGETAGILFCARTV